MNGSIRRGFTLVEAMVSMTILALAGAVLLLGVETSLRTADEATEGTIAAGMARQLMDEVLGWPYVELGGDPYQYPLTAGNWEKQGRGRERFDDTDDFNNYAAQPAEDTWGIELGQGDGAGGLRHPNFRIGSGRYADWREEIEVYYVDEQNPSVRLPPAQTSNLRCVEVRISRENADGTFHQLARLRRVYAYVPAPS